MDHFKYRDGKLFAENVEIEKIVGEIETPFYLYSTATLERHYKVFTESIKVPNKLICYAMKANSNMAVIKTLAKLGAGVDVVSEGDIFRAMNAGVKPHKIVFSGVGKRRSEIQYGLKKKILQFNSESEAEVKMISEEAEKMGVKAPVSIRINPDVAADTHGNISTGKRGDKFGIDIDQAFDVIKKIDKDPNLLFKGVSVHIGSQIVDIVPFLTAFSYVVKFVKKIENSGIKVENIDFGGGLGVFYDSIEILMPDSYGRLISQVTKSLSDKKIIFEPGRMITANAGILVSKVILVKDSGYKKFAVVDAAMNDLIRPVLYNGDHKIVPVTEEEGKKHVYDFVGPVCESTDVFKKDYAFQEVKEGDLIAFRSAGAYGAVMAMEYNSRLLVPEVLVKDKEFSIVRKRGNYKDMIRNEKLPDWL